MVWRWEGAQWWEGWRAGTSCRADEGFLESLDLLLQHCIFQPCWAKFSADCINELVALHNITLKGADIFCWHQGLLVKGTAPALPVAKGIASIELAGRTKRVTTADSASEALEPR
jgi:hypothetical protein